VSVIFVFYDQFKYNYAEYLHQQGVQGLGYVINGPKDQLLGFKWYYAPIDYWRFCWYQRLLTATANLPTQAILIALILGDKTLLNAVDWQSFERTGTSYFMVISGLHIVLFAALGGVVARYLWALWPALALRIPAPQIGLAVGLVLGVVYGLMAGALVPTQCAVLMLLIVGLAKLCLRSISSVWALNFAFILIVAWNPLVIFSVAFWLSFIAVFFLIICFSGRLGKLKLWQEWTLPQWLMFWALLPVMVYTFNQFAMISLFTNLVSMPIMMLGVIPAALLGAFLIWFVPPLGVLALKLSNVLMLKLLYFLHYFAFQTWWGVWLAQITWMNMFFGLLGAFIVFLPKGVPGRWLGWFMFIPVILPIPTIVPLGQVQVTQLHTQNGVMTVLRSREHVLLITNVTNMRAVHGDLKHIVAAYCVHEGIHQIDMWVVNLRGNYHSLLNLTQDLSKLHIQTIASNHNFGIYDSHLWFCGKTTSWTWDNVQFTLIQNPQKFCELHFSQDKFLATSILRLNLDQKHN
jgi:competence protein ComEC